MCTCMWRHSYLNTHLWNPEIDTVILKIKQYMKLLILRRLYFWSLLLLAKIREWRKKRGRKSSCSSCNSSCSRSSSTSTTTTTTNATTTTTTTNSITLFWICQSSMWPQEGWVTELLPLEPSQQCTGLLEC